MDSFKSFISVFVLSAVFCFFFLNFAYNLQVSNGVNDTILGNESSKLRTFNSTISSSLMDFNQSARRFQNDTEDETKNTYTSNPSGALSLTGIYKSFITFSKFIVTFLNNLIPLFEALGIPWFILTIFSMLIIFIMVLLFYRLWKWGS